MSQYKKKNTSWAGYAKYSSLAFQMFAFLGLSLIAGKYLDRLVGWETPVITIALLSLAFVGFLFKLVRELK
jgi:hypothetical protein